MVLCTIHPHHWLNLTKYKLLIIQTACHFSSSAWLEYDLAFRKDATASGLSNWPRMNLELYNFHLRSPALASTLLPLSSPSVASALSPAASHDTNLVPPFCHSLNDRQCSWPFDTAAGTVKVITPRSTVHFPTPLAHDPGLPYPGGGGKVLNGWLCPVMPVYIV